MFDCVQREKIGAFGAVWDRLAAAQSQYVPSFSDVLETLRDPDLSIRIVGWRIGKDVTALAAFAVHDTERRFWLGEKPVFRMPVRAATLLGSASLGEADPAAATTLLNRVINDRSIDLVVFSDMPKSDSLYTAIAARRWRGPASISHHRAVRRLAPLPPSIDDYWASLRPSTRKAGLRDLRMFERLNPTYTVFTSPAEAAAFLPRAAAISARTYQLGLGHGIEETSHLRDHFARLAGEGRFRGYLASLDGIDVAFVWGDVSHGVFYFRTTGFDPAFARTSPGKAILIAVLRDLIDSGAARTFDFSGRDMAFKERFSTTAIPCANVIISRWSRPRGVVAVWLDQGFVAAKSVAPRVLGIERLRRLKRALRR